MTPKQTRIYWAAWGAVRKACQKAGAPVPDRHELHRRAFHGQDKSSKDFNTTTDLDAILAVFHSISEPDNLNAQLRPFKQAEQRVTHARMNHVALLSALFSEGLAMEGRATASPITHDPATASPINDPDLQQRAERYLSTILENRFKVRFITDLSAAPTYGKDQERKSSPLMQYIYTVSRAIERLRLKKKWSRHDLYTRAGLKCTCLACARARAAAPTRELVAAKSNQPF